MNAMTPEQARELVTRGPGVRTGSLDDMLAEWVEAPTLLALLSTGSTLEDAQRIAEERKAAARNQFLNPAADA